MYQRFKPAAGIHLWVRDFFRWLHAKYIVVRPAPLRAREQVSQRMTHIRVVCNQVSLFLSPSRFLRKQFISFGVPPEKIIFSECGLPPLVFRPDDEHHIATPAPSGTGTGCAGMTETFDLNLKVLRSETDMKQILMTHDQSFPLAY